MFQLLKIINYPTYTLADILKRETGTLETVWESEGSLLLGAKVSVCAKRIGADLVPIREVTRMHFPTRYKQRILAFYEP